MSAKQDRQGARTATDLERKYNFGKTFAELIGLITDARDSVDAASSELRSEIETQATSLRRDSERIVAEAVKDYVKETDLEEVRKEISSDFEQTAEHIASNFKSTTEEIAKVSGDVQGVANALQETRKEVAADFEQTAEHFNASFTSTTKEIENVNGRLQSVTEKLEKHFEFTVDGLTIKAGSGTMSLQIDNDIIRFYKNGQEFGWWDGWNFHTGNIYIAAEERAQFGNFAFTPRSNGSMDFGKVGG